MSIIIGKQIAKPLQLLKQGAQRVAQGLYQTKVELGERDDELGELATSFNQMVVATQERDLRLDLYAKNLEQLIEDRTRELDEQKILNVQASRMAALGEMAGGIAHEINTPLGTIQLVQMSVIDALLMIFRTSRI